MLQTALKEGPCKSSQQNAYCVTKSGRPFTDYETHCRLDDVKGLKLGTAYRNIKGAQLLANAIAETIVAKRTTLITQAPFFSLTMDGTAYVSGDEQESLYVRFSLKGVIHTKFLNLGRPASGTSENIFASLLKQIEEAGLHQRMDTMVGFGSDGAASARGRTAEMTTGTGTTTSCGDTISICVCVESSSASSGSS